jgi:uncharacterized protein YbgA (DUF1722 family)
MERVKVYPVAPGRAPAAAGRGLFAHALLEAYPSLPVEEEGRLTDPRLGEGFITRVFAYRRLTALRESGPSPGEVVAFHTAHKYLILAHSPEAYARLGRLTAAVKATPRAAFLARYAEELMAALALPATTRRHVNVLQHIAGFFKDRLDAAERRELAGLIADFAAGLVPLVVPITLINHFVGRHRVAYIADQIYLHPHPRELMLRNHT